ncbi:LptF/LptG family permease [Reinekea blandensis]|uniref:Predicted Permease n=1 Tax=Reinekea blandensis MED297 TaxID=314283 RepID=A4BIX3_9GAMM|nr:LptF/LptG family permease [Reinekea blandensis]EAR07906.1 predicted Permease [Reinekea sp. MED297] [Reinekea blandensis MED297]
MTLYRYLYGQIMKPFVFMTLVLLILLIATEISDTLTKILTGQFSDNALWVVIGFQVPILLQEILPAAFFLACLTTLHRLSQDSERAILHAIGISDGDLLRFLLVFAALPAMLLVLALNHYITPKAQENLELYVTEQLNRPITDIIDANSFYNIGAINATFYAARNNSQTQSLEDVFTIAKSQSSYTVTAAKEVRTQGAENAQYFQFFEGEQTQFSFDESEPLQTQRFGMMQLRIEEDGNASPWQRRNALTSFELAKSEDRHDQLTLISRFATSLYLPLFCIWAVVLTRFKPRSAKVGAMALGIVLYILTNFAYRTLHGAVGRSDLSILFQPWWFFVVLGVIALITLRGRA